MMEEFYWDLLDKRDAALTRVADLAAARVRERDLAVARADSLDRQYGDLRQQFDDLLARFTQLRLMGAHSVEASLGTPEAPAQDTDELRALVLESTRGLPPYVRDGALRQLDRDRGANMPIDVIRRRIMEGVPTDGTPA